MSEVSFLSFLSSLTFGHSALLLKPLSAKHCPPLRDAKTGTATNRLAVPCRLGPPTEERITYISQEGNRRELILNTRI